ncbi:TetR/AcrR family transcriptional regulator [Rhodococcus sp. X156]|uniref:TetR/AcrR family transcriptional regulator n=1 Tax=Rhodococcus sp. X156 TaxID=2499145 RepID=UPI001F498B4C|nr:TetR/AcrR family transcriptional regulator [Rhodococcus sp. X156]
MTSEPATGAPPADVAPVRRRPKNRKAQIAATAAEAFSENGYHAVGVADIASRLGISGPALYRHFPNKYALFRHAAMTLADALVAATDEAAEQPAEDAEEQLRHALLAIIATTLDNRRTGGLYRWEGRYLRPADRARLREKITRVSRRLVDPLSQLRPELTARDAQVLGVAALSVIASTTAHRGTLSTDRARALLLQACWSVLRCELPSEPGVEAPPARVGLAVASKREVLLQESVALFHRRGYHEVSIEEIGAAAGMNASGVYRHFASKSDLLATAFHRASERLTQAITSSLAASRSPQEGLARLVEVYVELSFAQSELMSVYFAEIGNLPADQRATLRTMQRLNVEEWVHLLAEVRPDLAAAQARFLVHAAFGLVLDVGRLLRFSPTAEAHHRVEQLMLTTMLGRPASRSS